MIRLDVEVVEVETLPCGHHKNPQFVGAGYEGGACPWCGENLVKGKGFLTVFRDSWGNRCSQIIACENWGAIQQIIFMFCLGAGK